MFGLSTLVSPAAADDPAALPLYRLERELTEQCAQVYAGTCRWLELVREFDRRDGWMSSDGCRSCADWLAWRCALTPRAAREHVRVARSLGALERVREAFARGELSYSKVRAITRIATPESEMDLLELARHATAAQLERMIRAARRVSAEEAGAVHELAYCVHSWASDGSLHVRAVLPPEDGAALVQALNASRDALRERHRAEEAANPALPGSAVPPADGREGNPPRASRRTWPTSAECLAHVAYLALAQPPDAAQSSSRHQIVIHIESDGHAHVGDGPGVCGETAARLACDATVVPLVESPGSLPLSVGRKTRVVPTPMRRALEARDGGCRFPGCEQRRFTDSHHIRHWAQGGETSLPNLILLCRRHHRLLHEGGYSIEQGEDGPLAFRNRHGVPIPAAPPLPASPAAVRHPTRPVLAGAGERMDLDLCVSAVLSAMGSGRGSPRPRPDPLARPG
jgi:Domain of unknown function (DUF222)/HNH endonuclease